MNLKQKLTKENVKKIAIGIFATVMLIRVATQGYEFGQWLRLH